MRIHNALLALLLLLLTQAPARQAHAAPDPPPDHWVATWATANTPANPPPNTIGATDTTYREFVRTTLAGPLVRLELSNEFGTQPLLIGAVHIALAEIDPSHPGDISITSANALTFGGLPSITIPPGATAISDPAALTLPPKADLAISIFLPAQQITVATMHGGAHTTSFTVPGNLVGQKTLPNPTPVTSWTFIKSVDVKTVYNAAAIVTFGDSITEGAASTQDAHNTWPDVFARRLQADKKTSQLAVINEGIGGNRLLHDGSGPSALARFDRDVLANPAVRSVILLEGINDIGHAESPTNPTHDATAEALIQALTQLTERAHTHGLKVYAATILPYLGAKYSSPAGEQIRLAVNTWIRTSRQLDGVIDFDATMRDKSTLNTLNPAYDSGDHLHPSPAGYKAMAESIDLNQFTLNKKEKYDITHQQ